MTGGVVGRVLTVLAVIALVWLAGGLFAALVS